VPFKPENRTEVSTGAFGRPERHDWRFRVAWELIIVEYLVGLGLGALIIKPRPA